MSARGTEHLPPADPGAGPALVVANHTTVVDVAVVLHVLQVHGIWVDAACPGGCAPGHRHAKVLATADILRFPVSRQLAARSGAIPVEDGGGSAALRAARRALDDGEVVVIYPEGNVSATDDGAPRPWRPGTAALARAAGAPVHPLAHHDSRELGRGSVPMSLLRAAGGVVRLPRIRAYAGEAVTAEQVRATPARELEPLLAARLRSTWDVARTGVLPPRG